MTTPIIQSYGQQLSELLGFIQSEWRADSPEGLFALHLFDAAGELAAVPPWPPSPDPAGLDTGYAPALAVFGYAVSRLSAFPPDDADRWRAGAKRLAERNAFPHDRQSFAFRPLELYGICLGAAKLLPTESAERAWLADVLHRAEGTLTTGLWAKLISRRAAKLLGVHWSGEWPPADACETAEELAVLRWIASVDEHAGARAFDPRPIDEAILKLALVSRSQPSDVARAAMLYQALRRASQERLQSDIAATWQVSRPTRDAVEVVTAICRRFHAFTRQMQIRHDKRAAMQFDDEYDVQDAIHAILRLHFSDVRSEEWTPSYAGKSTRIDFLLKRERVAVEVKMTRPKLRQKEIISQLTEDKERYRVHADCQYLVCFVYDPTGKCDNPAALESDLSVTTGDFRVTVIVAPQGS